jgi:hypothetical protein
VLFFKKQFKKCSAFIISHFFILGYNFFQNTTQKILIFAAINCKIRINHAFSVLITAQSSQCFKAFALSYFLTKLTKIR